MASTPACPIQRASFECGADRQEPIRVLRKRAQKLGTLPGRESCGRGVSRSAKEMQRAVAQTVCTNVGAIGAVNLDVDAFSFEETEFHRSDGYKIVRER